MADPARQPPERRGGPTEVRETRTEARRPMGGAPWIWGLLFALILAGAGWWAWAAFQEDESAGPEQAVTLSEISSDPAQFFGQEVTVTGDVSTVFDPQGAFWIGGDDADSAVLVVSSQGLDEGQIAEDETVQVTGTVREFDAVEFQEEFGDQFEVGFEEDPFFEGFVGRPAIVADSISIVQGNQGGNE